LFPANLRIVYHLLPHHSHAQSLWFAIRVVCLRGTKRQAKWVLKNPVGLKKFVDWQLPDEQRGDLRGYVLPLTVPGIWSTSCIKSRSIQRSIWCWWKLVCEWPCQPRGVSNTWSDCWLLSWNYPGPTFLYCSPDDSLWRNTVIQLESIWGLCILNYCVLYWTWEDYELQQEDRGSERKGCVTGGRWSSGACAWIFASCIWYCKKGWRALHCGWGANRFWAHRQSLLGISNSGCYSWHCNSG
jgi:hypothetical protein